MQHRDREQAVLPHDDAGLLDRAARPEPAGGAAANNCFKPYTPGTHAGRSGDDDDDNGRHGAVHRARRARHDEPRHLRHRGAVRSEQAVVRARAPARWNGKVVYTFGASTGQPRLQFRTEQNWADDAALSRGFMVVDNSLTDSLYNSNRVLDAETVMMMKEHIVDTYGEIKYIDWQRLLGRLDPAEHRRVDLPGAARRHPADLQLSRLDHHRARGHRLRAARERLCRRRVDGADGRG